MPTLISTRLFLHTPGCKSPEVELANHGDFWAVIIDNATIHCYDEQEASAIKAAIDGGSERYSKQRNNKK